MAGAPNVSVATTCQAPVTFNVNATTYVGESIWLVGNTSELGNWDVGNAQEMDASGYTAERPLWSLTGLEMQVGEGVVVAYKFFRMEDCGQVGILESTNRTVVLGGCGAEEGVVLEDAWEGEVGVSGDCGS